MQATPAGQPLLLWPTTAIQAMEKAFESRGFLLTQGMQAQNRAVEGDEVALRLLPIPCWFVSNKKDTSRAPLADANSANAKAAMLGVLTGVEARVHLQSTANAAGA